MPESANTQDSDTLVRFGIRPTEAAPYSVAGAENWRRLFVRQALGQQSCCLRVQGHEFRVSALKLDPCGLLVGAKMFAPAQAPFASAAGRLDPRNTDAVSEVSRPYTRTDRDNLTHGVVAENSRERARKMSERLVNIGVANTARVHLDENLIRTQLGLRNVLNFPWTVHRSDNGSS
jgi:hypothetical protein